MDGDSLYELTRKLVRRGCPEHPRLVWFKQTTGWRFDPATRRETGKITIPGCWTLAEDESDDADCREVHPDDARAIWTMHALEWWQLRVQQAERPQVVINGYMITHLKEWGEDTTYGKGDTILEAIEAATRHMEPS